VKGRNPKMSEDILFQVIADMEASPYFATQLDEATDADATGL
jgi:hypothetical protein